LVFFLGFAVVFGAGSSSFVMTGLPSGPISTSTGVDEAFVLLTVVPGAGSPGAICETGGVPAFSGTAAADDGKVLVPAVALVAELVFVVD
jgi:hypothetical protein